MTLTRGDIIGKARANDDKIKDLLEEANNALEVVVPTLNDNNTEQHIELLTPALKKIKKATDEYANDIESIQANKVQSLINSIEKKMRFRDDSMNEKQVNDIYYKNCGYNHEEFKDLSLNKILLPIKTKVKNEHGTPIYKDGIYEGPDNENLILTDDYKKFGPDGTENRGYPLAEFREDMDKAEKEPCPKPGINNDKYVKKLAPDSRARFCATRLKKNKEAINKKCDESNACRGGGSRNTRRKRGKSSKRKSSKKSRKTKRKSLKKRRRTSRR